jgi:4,5-dihydroxyphthalate decarboxylase
VYLKVTERNLVGATAGKATPETFFGRLVAEFGASRIAWGSNFPASERSLSRSGWRSQRTRFAFLPEADREWIFARTARDALSKARGSAMTLSPRVCLFRSIRCSEVTRGTDALKSGRVSSSLVTFDFADVKVINTQFKAVVRELKYDFAELAIATYLQGREYGQTVCAAAGHDHGSAVSTTRSSITRVAAPLTPPISTANASACAPTPSRPACGCVGFLAGDYDVDLQSITWVTFREPHVAEYRDPPNVERAPTGKELKQMLLDGEVDAAILGDIAEQGPLKHLFPDHAAEAQRWARAHGGVPSTIWRSFAARSPESRPDVVREVYRLLKERPRGRCAACGTRRSTALWRQRHSANRWNRAIAYSHHRGLISRRPTADELFARRPCASSAPPRSDCWAPPSVPSACQ